MYFILGPVVSRVVGEEKDFEVADQLREFWIRMAVWEPKSLAP